MDRRDFLGGSSAVLAVGVSAGLAGCSGDDGSGSDDEPDDDETTTDPGDDTSTPAQDGGPRGSVGNVAVDGLSVADWSAEPSDDELRVTVTVENVGDQTTDAFSYNYELALYDSSETDITGDPGATGSMSDTEVSPGEQTTINVYYGVDGTPEDVASYEISLNCDGPFSDGSYC